MKRAYADGAMAAEARSGPVDVERATANSATTHANANANATTAGTGATAKPSPLMLRKTDSSSAQPPTVASPSLFRFGSLDVVGSFASRFAGSLWGNSAPASIDARRGNALVDSSTASPTFALTGSSTFSIASAALGHRRIKSSSSALSVASQPVVVRTYTPAPGSRTSSTNPSIHHRSASTPAATQSMPKTSIIPSIDAFSFDGILRAIEPDINEAIDGIAEIYSRSRLSLADEYGAHLPPQGEIIAPRTRHSGLAIRTTGLERTLTTVTEASSSSERLAGGSKAGSIASGKGKATAYGSLRSIISRGRSNSRSSSQVETPIIRSRPVSTSWSISRDSTLPMNIIKKQDMAPNQLSLASVAETPRDKAAPIDAPNASIDSKTPASIPSTRPTSWLNWTSSFSRNPEASIIPKRKDAESSLKEVLHGMPNASPNHEPL